MESNCLDIRKQYYKCCRETNLINCKAELEVLYECLHKNYYS